jgi:hypothetical protein
MVTHGVDVARGEMDGDDDGDGERVGPDLELSWGDEGIDNDAGCDGAMVETVEKTEDEAEENDNAVGFSESAGVDGCVDAAKEILELTGRVVVEEKSTACLGVRAIASSPCQDATWNEHHTRNRAKKP